MFIDVLQHHFCLLYQSKLVATYISNKKYKKFMDSKFHTPQTFQQDLYKMIFASGLLLTCFLAYKLQKRPSQLCVLILISPLVVISFPVILFISKVRGRSQTTFTIFCLLLTTLVEICDGIPLLL